MKKGLFMLLAFCSLAISAQNQVVRRQSVKSSISDGSRKNSNLSRNGTTHQKMSYKTFYANGVAFQMAKVIAGTFAMGATSEMKEPFDSEKTVHQVTLSHNYYMGKTEVTQELWKAVMGNNPSVFKGDKKPVENVSWDDCQSFISRLNAITGMNFRLPTEAEWEFAARGGNNSRHYQYSGGTSLYEVGWYKNNSGDVTHIVATKKANELGIYDMSGNVEEWCQDWYGVYTNNPKTNPTGTYYGTERVIRDGCFDLDVVFLGNSRRAHCTPDLRRRHLGFRLALSE